MHILIISTDPFAAAGLQRELSAAWSNPGNRIDSVTPQELSGQSGNIADGDAAQHTTGIVSGSLTVQHAIAEPVRNADIIIFLCYSTNGTTVITQAFESVVPVWLKEIEDTKPVFTYYTREDLEASFNVLLDRIRLADETEPTEPALH